MGRLWSNWHTLGRIPYNSRLQSALKNSHSPMKILPWESCTRLVLQYIHIKPKIESPSVRFFQAQNNELLLCVAMLKMSHHLYTPVEHELPLSPRPCAHRQSILDSATFPDFIFGVDHGPHQGSRRSQPRSQLSFLRAKSK